MVPPTSANGGDPELRRAARGGLLTLVGAGGSAVLGFLFNVMLAREIGPYGAGIALQAIALFTIIVAVARVGLDTTAVWLLPQLVRTDPSRVRAAVVALLVPAALIPLAITAGWLLLRGTVLSGASDGVTSQALTVVLLFLPAGSVMIVALACTRAFGGVLPINLVQNLGVPAMRPVGLLVVAAWGGGALAATMVWAVPWAVGMVAALAILAAMVLRFHVDPGSRWKPDAELVRRVFGYSLPRMVMASMEQTIIWADVLIVGMLLGASDAGVYGSAARFVAAGIVVVTALRVVVAPQFSGLLADRQVAAVQELYAVTARWILLFGAPIYLLLAVFAPTVLRWLGRGFDEGVTSMVILCLGSVVVVAAGNIQTLLLMSGGSGWGAVNKTFVVIFNIVGNVVLVPRIGIEGAAITWAASMMLDTALAAWRVWRLTGISLTLKPLLATLAAVVACVAAPALLVERLLGQGTSSLALAGVLAALALLCYAYADRRRLRLDQLRHRGGRPGGAVRR